MSSTDHIYHLAASRLGDKCDRSMTLVKLLDNNAVFHFHFLNDFHLCALESALSAWVSYYTMTLKEPYVMSMLPPPPLLRQCIATFAVDEGSLLLDMGWFVLFFLLGYYTKTNMLHSQRNWIMGLLQHVLKTVLYMNAILRRTKNKAWEYRGMFEIQKSGDKTSSGEIGLDIRTHASPKVGQDQVSGLTKEFGPTVGLLTP